MIDEALLLVIKVAGATVSQEVRKTHNRIKWGSQFVTHIGKKFALQLRGALHLAVAKLELLIGRSQAVHESSLFRFVPLSLRHVNCHNHVRRPAGKAQRVRGDFYIDVSSIFKAMPPDSDTFHSISDTSNSFEHGGNVLRW